MNGNEWIKELKVGDKVAITSRNGRSITTIAKITPTGIIKTEKGSQFNPDGFQRGGDGWGAYSLQQLTDEVKLEFKKNGLVRKCKEVDFSKLTIEQLEQILNIIE